MTKLWTVILIIVSLSACNASIVRTPPTLPPPSFPGVTQAAISTSQSIDAGLPPVSSPGAINPAVTQANIHQTICVSGWTNTVRPPASYTTALKRQQMAALHLTGPISAYEEDHRVPLSSGGAPRNPANLWPELWNGPRGAHAKDTIEDRVHADICSGHTDLTSAQKFWMGNFWTLPIP